jgi:ATP/maltotriose-dependent transcriptional regulator MalT
MFFEASGFKQVSGAAALTFCYSSLNAWTIGRADTARDRMRRAIAAAGESNSHFDLAMAQKVAAELHLYLRDPEMAEMLASQAVALSDQYGFALGRRFSQICLGRARAQLGHAAEGVALIRQGLAGMAEVGASTGISRYLTYLAEAQAFDGATDDALGTIEQALAPDLQELYFRPETLRIRGELRYKRGLINEADYDFREAIALAQKMNAKTLELRATMSLARLCGKRGKPREARAMLAEIYGWFTEGFDTPDLKDTKALLDELAG